MFLLGRFETTIQVVLFGVWESTEFLSFCFVLCLRKSFLLVLVFLVLRVWCGGFFGLFCKVFFLVAVEVVVFFVGSVALFCFLSPLTQAFSFYFWVFWSFWYCCCRFYV